MTRSTRIKEGQTVLDITIQEMGDIQALFIVALLNDIAITDDLILHKEIMVQEAAVNNLDIVGAFSSYSHKPASGLTAEDILELGGGIGFMGIQLDFKVS